MGFFDNLFDKREKMDYCQGCQFLFNLALIHKVKYTESYSDIDDMDYSADIVGVLTAFLDTKPKEKSARGLDTFGEDAMYYGTVHGTMLVDTHPIQANLKTVFLPKCKEKHKHYSNFVKQRMNNSINATTAHLLAGEILRVNGVPADAAKVNAIVVDINALIEVVNGLLSTYRFV